MRSSSPVSSVALLPALFLSGMAWAAQESIEVARIQAATWSYVVFAVTVTLVKIVSLILGYLIARLGYNTMMAGVKGQDSVDLSLLGITFKFKGITPGLALGLFGIVLMIWALSTKHHFSAETSQAITSLRSESAVHQTSGGGDSKNAEQESDQRKPAPPPVMAR